MLAKKNSLEAQTELVHALLTVKPTVHTNPSRKRSFSKNALQTGGIKKNQLFVFVWTENIFMLTELFKNDDIMIIT